MLFKLILAHSGLHFWRCGGRGEARNWLCWLMLCDFTRSRGAADVFGIKNDPWTLQGRLICPFWLIFARLKNYDFLMLYWTVQKSVKMSPWAAQDAPCQHRPADGDVILGPGSPQERLARVYIAYKLYNNNIKSLTADRPPFFCIQTMYI